METKKWNEFEKDLKQLCSHWHNHRKLSLRSIQKMLQFRGVSIHYSTISRWLKRETVAQNTPGSQTTIQESKIMVKGQSLFLYALMTAENQLVDFKFYKKPKPASLDMFEFKSQQEQQTSQLPWATAPSELEASSNM